MQCNVAICSMLNEELDDDDEGQERDKEDGTQTTLTGSA